MTQPMTPKRILIPGVLDSAAYDEKLRQYTDGAKPAAQPLSDKALGFADKIRGDAEPAWAKDQVAPSAEDEVAVLVAALMRDGALPEVAPMPDQAALHAQFDQIGRFDGLFVEQDTLVRAGQALPIS